jgi:hypothetical protein
LRRFGCARAAAFASDGHIEFCPALRG